MFFSALLSSLHAERENIDGPASDQLGHERSNNDPPTIPQHTRLYHEASPALVSGLAAVGEGSQLQLPI